MRHVTRRLGPCCLAALALVACNGDDTTLPTEPPVQPRDTTTTVEVPTTPPATSAPAPSSAPTTIVAPTSAPPITVTLPTIPPTSVMGFVEDAALLAVDSYYAAWRNCVSDYQTCDPASFAGFMDQPSQDALAAQIADGKATFRVAENVESYTYDLISVEAAETRIVVTVCQRDGIVVYLRPPGQPEQFVTDRFVSKRREWYVDLLDGVWRIVGSVTLEEAVGVENDLCA